MNNRGSITVDFLFAFVLVSGFSMIIMTFSATLSMVEVVQYMAYASSRNYFASHLTEAKQKEAAVAKFIDLKNNPVIAPLLSGGWFSSPEDDLVVDYDIPSKYAVVKNGGGQQWQYPVSEERLNLFHGVIAKFNAKILDFQIPFFGSTQSQSRDGTGNSEGFTAYITSFLGREPSFEECNNFNEARWANIKRLSNQRGAATYGNARPETAVVINDNGC